MSKGLTSASSHETDQCVKEFLQVSMRAFDLLPENWPRIRYDFGGLKGRGTNGETNKWADFGGRSLTTSIWPGNPADTYHKGAMKDPNNISWSYYWHQAVDRLCFGPGGE